MFISYVWVHQGQNIPLVPGHLADKGMEERQMEGMMEEKSEEDVWEGSWEKHL